MKHTIDRFTLKRRLWGARLEVFARRVERWLDEHHEKAFVGFIMVFLFMLQILLFLR